MFLLGILPDPVGMFESERIHLHQLAVGAEYLFHVFSNQIQRVEDLIRVIEDAARPVSGVSFHGYPPRLTNHLTELSRPHQLAVLGAGGCGDAFVYQRAAQIVHSGVQQ